jgi:DNA polymerase-3 subunit epsilon
VKYLLFDTETTGLLDKYAPLDSDLQPDCVEIAMVMLDDDLNTICELSSLVIPNKEIAPEAFEKHRISHEMCEEYGMSRRLMCAVFQNYAKRADVIVAHNIDFDMKLMLSAFAKEKVSSEAVRNKQTYCTKLATTPICKIPSPFKPGDYKWPTLMEAYCDLVDPAGFPDAHRAMADVKACVGVLRALKTRHANK